LSALGGTYLADVPSDNLPVTSILTRPDPGIAKHPANDGASDIYRQASTQGSDSNAVTNSPNPQLFRFVLEKSNCARAVRLQVLCLCANLSRRAGEQQVIGDKPVKRFDVRIELRFPNLLFERNDFRI
jgi:hypothetical protein